MIPPHKIERLLIWPRLGTLVDDRVEAPLTTEGDVIERIDGRFRVLLKSGNGTEAYRDIELVLTSVFGTAQPVEVGLEHHIAALGSKDPEKVEIAVDIFTVVHEPRACAPLRALKSGNLGFMREALSVTTYPSEFFDAPGTGPETVDYFPDFRRRLSRAVAKCPK